MTYGFYFLLQVEVDVKASELYRLYIGNTAVWVVILG